MSWAKLDDHLRDHPKVMGLGRERYACMGVWLDALCYASEHLTDGILPSGLVSMYPKRLVVLLVEAGLWERGPEGYEIHDYLEMNPSRERVFAERSAARERMNNARTSGEQTAKFRPRSHSPSRPVPSRTSYGSTEAPDVVGPRLAAAGKPL